MFTMICTRLVISQVEGVVNQYMANPSREHWKIVKIILQYIRGTLNVALCYGGSEFIVQRYAKKIIHY